MTPAFLTLEEALAIHRDQIARYGGTSGIRDFGMLVSALAQPQAMFAGRRLHSSLNEMAAAYLFHIVQNHPFVDGNKRVGAVAAIVFLDLNGLDFHATEVELEKLVLSVASGASDKSHVADFFARHTR
jgi:death-on-curing protein